MAIAALLAAALLVPAVASALPGRPVATPAHPTVGEVQHELSKLGLKNAQLVEKFDQAQVAVRTKTRAAKAAARVAVKADKAFRRAQDQLGAAAAAMYEGGAFSTTGALLTSDSGESYLDELTTLSMINSHNAQIVSNLIATQKKAEKAQKRADDLLHNAEARRDKLMSARKQVQAQLNKYSNLLDTLTAVQRTTYLQQVNPALSTARVAKVKRDLPKAPSAGANQAVTFALHQVGKPYYYGAAGPSSYDCSGLTMRAWGSAGVSLPHSAAAQYNYGTHVSFNDLRPGDLMFFYSPISHVTIYIGNGLMVSAPETGQDVSVVPANEFGSDFVGATRL